MCELKSETQRSNARVILAPQYAILWWPLGGRTIFEVFMFPESSALPPPNVLNITHRGQLDVRCRYCLTMQYLNKCDSSLLLTTETVHDDSSPDPYSPTYRLAVYRMDFQHDGRLGLKELHCFPLRNPSYLLRANTVIKRHGMIFLISLQSHNPHYIVLTLQCDTTGKDWELEFKKESMTVLHVEPPYNILCNVTKGELLWIDKDAMMFKHRLTDETQ
ncbi:hypothetical protein ONZ45_g3168 [Pleurotus djamor]|nr:hypothetical protein ONZ45_g3168 [Pleurotus djamor]